MSANTWRLPAITPNTNVATVTKTYTQNFFQQVRSDFFLGMPLEGSDSITFSVSSGAALVYGTSTDNQTQDPSFQSTKRI